MMMLHGAVMAEKLPCTYSGRKGREKGRPHLKLNIKFLKISCRMFHKNVITKAKTHHQLTNTH
jgi:hypothetical protein